MFFSVSIPIYNSEHYLDRCIQSVINQTEKDFELVLVDDGSSDNSCNICEKWVSAYPEKIRLIRKDNSGSLFTRRICLEASKGDYLYVMDSDDYLIDKDALRLIRQTIEREKCDLVFFNCTINEKSKEKYFSFPYCDGHTFSNKNLSELKKQYLVDKELYPLWNKVFYRELVDWGEDYTSYSNITNGTDCFQSTPIISNAKKIVYIDRVFYYYHFFNNKNSIVHTFKSTIYISAQKNFLRKRQESLKWGINEIELQKLLRKSYMQLASTSVFKLRLASNDDVDELEFLKMIGEDSLFLEYYDISVIDNLYRKIIVFLLKKKKYKILKNAIHCLKHFYK